MEWAALRGEGDDSIDTKVRVVAGMNVLVVGSGAREHAVAWKLAGSPRVDKLFITPGNAGTSSIGTNLQPSVEDSRGPEGLARLAALHDIGLTMVGPEAHLAEGIVDIFEERGLAIFGPTKAAARVESSKAFAKELMRTHGIPSAEYKVFHAYSEARNFLSAHVGPVVVKADGLAAGKGVAVCAGKAEALNALHGCMEDRAFGDAGDTVVIEEYLEGREVSVFGFSDGKHLSHIVAACDYKRLLDGDAGPNTGGMGSYSPPEFWTPKLAKRIEEDIMVPTIQAMQHEGTPYRGILYAGLMVTEDGPRVLEFNCRLGDPEAQVILPLLDTDLMEVLLASINGEIDVTPTTWVDGACVGIVMASGGYPGEYARGLPISGLEEVDAGVEVFHGASRQADRGERAQVLTDGGRVLTIVGRGATLEQARNTAYDNVGKVSFQNAHYRRDIAMRATPMESRTSALDATSASVREKD